MKKKMKKMTNLKEIINVRLCISDALLCRTAGLKPIGSRKNKIY